MIMKRKVCFVFTAAIAMATTVSAQDRFDNVQYSLNVGTMSVPQPTFATFTGFPMVVEDDGVVFPWNAGFRMERERMASDQLGWGWSIGIGVRRTGWLFTVPAGTAGVGWTGLTHDDDWRVKIGFMGFTVDGGLFASLHVSPVLEVYGGAGLAVARYWELGSKAECGSYVDDAAGAVTTGGLSATLMGVYGLAGVKLTFNEDFFVSLSARYVYGLDDETVLENDITWDGPFYRAHASAPFANEVMVLLGVGIMIEQ